MIGKPDVEKATDDESKETEEVKTSELAESEHVVPPFLLPLPNSRCTPLETSAASLMSSARRSRQSRLGKKNESQTSQSKQEDLSQ